MDKKELLRQFLLAWRDSTIYKAELLPTLAETLGTTPSEILYRRGMSPDFQYSGVIANSKWRYFYHGLADCDLEHLEDDRFLQIHVGPHGRADVFSGWATMLYIMASKPPWPEYIELKNYLAEAPPPYKRTSGSHERMVDLLKPICDFGLFEAVDKELALKDFEMQKIYTRIDEEGGHIFSPPAPYNDIHNREFWDLMVCHQWVLSELGEELFANNLEPEAFYALWPD